MKSRKNEHVYCEGYVTINDEEAEDVEEKIIEFKIIAKENENITLSGCVNINTIDDDEPDFKYKNLQGVYTPQRCWDIQSETSSKLDEEERMIRENICNKVNMDVCNDYTENAQCLWDFQNENKTIERDSYYLIINEGAKMECEIVEHPEIDSYMVELIPKFNGKKIDLVTYMKETSTDFDPWYVDDGKDYIEDGKIFFEMSSDYWEDSDSAQDRLKDVNEEARSIYAMFLTKELGIYSKYGEVMEQLMDANCDDEWLFKMSQMVNKSDEELDSFLKAEGFIDEELDY